MGRESLKLESNSYRPSDKADKNDSLNDEEWRDELGSCTVDIAAGVRFWKGIVSCKFPVQRKEPWRIHDNVGYCTPIAHLYYQPEGSSEWKFCGVTQNTCSTGTIRVPSLQKWMKRSIIFM